MNAIADLPIDAIRAFCVRNQIAELSVFGSVARGEGRSDSDLDLLVTFLPDAKVSLFSFAEMQAELADIIGRPVDLVDREGLVNPFMRRTILGDAAVLYAA